MKTGNRYGIIIGSSVLPDKSCHKIPDNLRKSVTDEFKETLMSFGQYSFIWPNQNNENPLLLSNKEYGDFIKRIDKVSPNKNDVAMVYYFGHGVPYDGKLCLSLKGIEKKSDRTQYTINNIAKDLNLAGFKK